MPTGSSRFVHPGRRDGDATEAPNATADPPHFCPAPPAPLGQLPLSLDRFDPRFYDGLYALEAYEHIDLNNYGYAPLDAKNGAGDVQGEPYQRQMYVEVLKMAPAWWPQDTAPAPPSGDAAVAAATATATATTANAGTNTKVVLEVGCGNGGGLAWLRSMAARKPGAGTGTGACDKTAIAVGAIDCSNSALLRAARRAAGVSGTAAATALGIPRNHTLFLCCG